MSLRCSVCDLDWPETSAFGTCPGCGEKTWEAKGESTIAWQEAHQLAMQMKAQREKYEAFEKFLAKRDAERNKAWEQIVEQLKDPNGTQEPQRPRAA